MLSAHLKKGFTLIEVLVVIGILGILATVALVAINPAEAQKKARDTQRLKDMATLQSVFEQYISDNPGAFTNVARTSSNGIKVCGNTNWMALNFCPYLSILPIDPSNKTTQVINNTGTTIGTTPQAATAYYYFNYVDGAYKFCTRLESLSNAGKALEANDGGSGTNSEDFFETYSLASLNCL